MNLNRSVATSIIFLIMFVLAPLPALGTALDNSGISHRGALMGSAMSGLADDASAVFFNPAGMVGPQRETAWDIELGAGINFSNFTYSNGTRENKSDDVFVLPKLYMSKRINDRWAAGIGIYTPFAGGGVTYENFMGTGYELSVRSGYTAVTPAVAYKINDRWAVGLGISGYYGIYRSKSFNPTIARFVDADYSGFAGYGGHASVMYRPSGPWSIGLTFRSPIHSELKGDVKIAGTEKDSKLEADLPYYIDFGLGYQKDKLKLGASLVWMAYGKMDELKQTTGGVTTLTKTGYKDSYRISLGGEYQAATKLYYYAGARFYAGATKDEFMNPLSNDVDMLALSGGVRFGITKSMDLLMGYLHVFGFEKTVGTQKFDQEYDTVIFSIRQQF
jgi:long-chain fatty acid transport protein